MIKNKNNQNLVSRPPIVVVLGHVDHGKTTLLDTIRKTNVVAKESGGITQHIGAYQIKYKGKLITFIDTPGHEAFCQMRSRGAKTADIAILVIAGEEGVKPQTKEVIECIKKEELPTIVAVNKMDNPHANFEKTIGELEKQGLTVEQRSGKTPAIKVSAVTGIGIDELLEMIILLAEIEELKVDISKPASGVVIESYMDSRKGATATFLVLEGILEVGQWVVCGSTYGKVKNLNDFKGEKIDKAEPSTPAIVIGLNEVPVVGDMFGIVESEEATNAKLKEKSAKSWSVPAGQPDSESVDKEKEVNVILKTDVHGSLEAIGESLAKLELGNIGLKILKADVGDISEADVKLAYPANAVIIGFRVKTSSDIENMAKRSGVKIRNYDIIYELFEGIKKEASKLLELESNREDLGKLKVIAIFRREKTKMIVGGKVSDGKIVNKTHIDIMRNEEKVGTGKIIQLQHNKQDMAEVEKGREAGIMFEGDAIIEEGDILECYRIERKKREL
ncbi:MAG TPA: translation initiation factor IF-2 [Candidatus Paceibacterota bacterium]|nr:translation initiation factor IF-2 [Candidatus Paceibacterota bacterium]